MGFLSGLMGGDVGKNSLKALAENKGLLTGFQTKGNEIINSGETKSADALNSSISGFQPWVDSGKAANSLYGDAIGLNGAEGNTRATGAFQTSPGYDFAVDQSMQAALRGASAAGMLNSGNTLTALQDRGNSLADQEYSSWLDRLKGTSDTGLQAVGGQANGYTNMSNLYQAGTGNRLNLESGVVQGLMGINNDTASIKDQQDANKNSFFGNLLSGVGNIGFKLATGGGLF